MRLFILLLTLSFSVFFKFIPTDVKVGFLLSDVVLFLDTYIWMLCEHLVIVGLALVAMLQEHKYKKAFIVYLFLQGIDTIGFVLAYGDPLEGFVITFNQLKIAIFGLAIFNELRPQWKTSEKR